MKDIDFRRGADGAGRVVVDLANNQIGVDIRQQGQSLVVEFLRSSLPDNLRRRLDVTDFGTPIQTVTTSQAGDRVRMVVEPRGVWEHSAYQNDNQFVLEVRTQKTDPNKLVQGAGYAGEKLSLNFQNIEVRALLQVIADFTNFNVVTSDTVTGNVTLRLKDVPWDQALDIILQAKNLGLKKSGNVILIAPKDELNAKEKIELEAKKQIAELEPLRTQAFQLNYTKAEEVAKGLTGQLTGQTGGTGGSNTTRILSARGTVTYDIRTNQLFITDVPSKLEDVQAMIARIDTPVRQVQIEARIVEANDTFGRSLGCQVGCIRPARHSWRRTGYGIVDGNRVTIGGNLNAVGSQTLQPGASADFSNTNFVTLAGQRQQSGIRRKLGGHLCAVAVQCRSESFPESRDFCAGGRWQGQDRLESANHHRRPGESVDPAGLEDSLSEGDEQRCDFGGVHRRGAEAGGDAADHARRQCDHDRRSEQGQHRNGVRRRAVDQYQVGARRRFWSRTAGPWSSAGSSNRTSSSKFKRCRSSETSPIWAICSRRGPRRPTRPNS